MQIKVKCSCGEGNCPEWAVVELQGFVEAQPSFQDRLHDLQIGLLCRPSSQETYTFTVGYHELTGTKVTLKKPILVLKKIKHGNDECEGHRPEKSSVELDVIGIIRHKILFKTRPKALISISSVRLRFLFNRTPTITRRKGQRWELLTLWRHHVWEQALNPKDDNDSQDWCLYSS
ncbi:hypothetical protein F511_06155 [Dorcoceras hygrometricum]|uniref:Chromosome transmission fidelity protein 8 n=1 Tax=Dorcoceras hygrometricum TaxID=472368 RepID=A0A2Z7CJM1_9LAMI|nr:hypothetical protein F511_06155 [Dorcoceras hygrometricum]